MGFPVSRESKFGDEAPVDELDLSVRVSNALSGAGIKTVGAFRDCDFGALNLGAKHHRRSIAKALAEWDAKGAAAWAKRESVDRVAAARYTLRALTDTERAALFREVGSCACATLVKGAVANPQAAFGALVGGLLGAALGASREGKPVLKALDGYGSHLCGSCALGFHDGHLHGSGCVCRDVAHGGSK